MRNSISNGGQIIPRIHSDIRILNGADYFGVDLITGGFPCQPYSLAGKRRGAADDRALWPEMRRVIAEARPRWVLAENVPGIINLELDAVLSDLEGIGYAAGTIVVPACAVDAPHRRDRVWIVAHDEERRGGAGLRQVETEQDGHQPSNGGGNVADSTPGGLGENGSTSRQAGHADECGKAVPDARCELLERRERESAEKPAQWEPEPGLGRVAHGIPEGLDGTPCVFEAEPQIPRVAHGIKNRVQRLKALGNAIVPSVAYQIIKSMIQSEESEPHGD